MNDLKHYLVYLITNTVDGKIYIGKHETYDPDDNYMGSGKHLKRAQEKYGINKFERTVLADFDEPYSMNSMEAVLVDEEFVARKDTYNITVGGNGGFYYAMKKWRELQNDDCYKKNEQEIRKARWKDESYRKKMLETRKKLIASEQYRNKISEGVKRYFSNHPGTFTGKRHTAKSLQKQHETFVRICHAKGCNNSNYGKHWWTNPETGESHPFFDKDVPLGWTCGRKMPNRNSQ